MTTKNPRINITIDEMMAGVLAQMAKLEERSVASMARDLILEGLERREDVALSKIAALRDTKNAARVAHADAWK